MNRKQHELEQGFALKPGTSAKRINIRRGLLKTEALLAAVVLAASLSFASTMVKRINRFWSDAQRHQFAISELSNQIDEFSRLSPDQASESLKSIEVSQACKETLKDASIVGEVEEDELGNRITLKLSWLDRKGANPVELSAWLRDEKTDGGEQ